MPKLLLAALSPTSRRSKSVCSISIKAASYPANSKAKFPPRVMQNRPNCNDFPREIAGL